LIVNDVQNRVIADQMSCAARPFSRRTAAAQRVLGGPRRHQSEFGWPPEWSVPVHGVQGG